MHRGLYESPGDRGATRCLLADGSLLVGATLEDVGFDERSTVAGMRELMDAVCGLLPAAARAGFAEVRVGLRPASPDGLPALGHFVADPAA